MTNGPDDSGGKTQHAVAIAAGLLISGAISAVSGRREAWDSGLYFVAGIPLMCLVVAWLAYHHPRRAWRWTVSMAIGQSLAMALAGSSLTLWPLALIATVVVSLPQFLTGLVASWMAARGAGPRRPAP